MAHTVHIGLVPPVGGAACCYGGYSVGETPGPIPNPEAKTHSADGTAPGRVWESRTPPDPFNWWPPGPPPSRGGAWRPPPFNPPLLSLRLKGQNVCCLRRVIVSIRPIPVGCRCRLGG